MYAQCFTKCFHNTFNFSCNFNYNCNVWSFTKKNLKWKFFIKEKYTFFSEKIIDLVGWDPVDRNALSELNGIIEELRTFHWAFNKKVKIFLPLVPFLSNWYHACSAWVSWDHGEMTFWKPCSQWYEHPNCCHL